MCVCVFVHADFFLVNKIWRVGCKNFITFTNLPNTRSASATYPLRSCPCHWVVLSCSCRLYIYRHWHTPCSSFACILLKTNDNCNSNVFCVIYFVLEGGARPKTCSYCLRFVVFDCGLVLMDLIAIFSVTSVALEQMFQCPWSMYCLT